MKDLSSKIFRIQKLKQGLPDYISNENNNFHAKLGVKVIESRKKKKDCFCTILEKTSKGAVGSQILLHLGFLGRGQYDLIQVRQWWVICTTFFQPCNKVSCHGFSDCFPLLPELSSRLSSETCSFWWTHSPLHLKNICMAGRALHRSAMGLLLMI